jgi:hypothetical protein
MKQKLAIRNIIWLLAVLVLTVVAIPALPAAAEADRGNPADLSFTGVIEVAGDPGESWKVGPQTVATDLNTWIVPEILPAAPGLWAEVDAMRQADGSYLAKRIMVLPEAVRLRGVVSAQPEAVDGSSGWVIAGVVVKVTADTKIGLRGGPVGVGNWVEAVMTEDGGILTAQRIIGIEPQDTVEVTGEVQAAGAGSWVLSSIKLNLNTDTLLGDQPAVVAGLIAHAAAQTQEDGSLLAKRLRVMWAEKQRPAFVKFDGAVEKLPEAGLRGEWTVGGKTVLVSPSTRINQERGLAVVGAEVHVAGVQADGKVVAHQITVLKSPVTDIRPVAFLGRIEDLPVEGVLGKWKVAGRTVVVSASTVLMPKDVTPKVGMWALVEGLRTPDGAVQARSVRVWRMGRPSTPDLPPDVDLTIE